MGGLFLYGGTGASGFDKYLMYILNQATGPCRVLSECVVNTRLAFAHDELIP